MAALQTATGTSTTTTVAATFGTTPTSGSLLVAGVMNTDNFATTPSGWTLAVQRGDHGGIELYYKVSNGTETTLTVTLGGAGSGSALMMAEFAHDGTTAGLLDKSASAGSDDSAVASQTTGTTATTTRATELAIAAVGWGGSSNSSTPTFSNTWTNSFVRAGTPASRQACGMTLAYKDLVATGTVTTTEGVSPSWLMQGIVATFKVNAPAGGGDQAVTALAVDGGVAPPTGHTVTTDNAIVASGKATDAGIGNATVTNLATIVATALADGGGVGTPSLANIVTGAGLDGSASPGTPTVDAVAFILALGLATGAALGQPAVLGDNAIVATGKATDSGVGNAAVAPGAATIVVLALDGSGGLGTPFMDGGTPVDIISLLSRLNLEL